ncbi:MAG: hypothetical protein GY811_09720 [Myxococcales bacterium]|nr:hypothetical protein [Myxococcales bacterium]
MLAGFAEAVATISLWMAPTLDAPLPADLAAQVDRLEGHEVQLGDGDYQIVNVAGEGAPLVGCIRFVGKRPTLVTSTKSYPLHGPLAVPRIAGPNYKAWVLGAVNSQGVLTARRLGILAGPSACEQPSPLKMPNN